MKQPARALLGYMTKEEAVQVLTGSGGEAPARAPELEAIWQRLANNVASREDFKPIVPVVDTPREIEPQLRAFSERPDVKAAMRPHNWTVGVVDLSKSVLSYQRLVMTRGAEARAQDARPDELESLLSICLPPPAPEQFKGSFDSNQNAFTAWSMNPNLRITGFGVGSATMPNAPDAQQIFGFTMSFGTRFVQVAQYRERWMIRDGYHRIYGLLKRGITKIPCVVIRANSFEETGAGRPGFFGYETILGDRPPRVTDFLSPDYSAEVEAQVVTRVIRIRAEEFVIPVHEPGELEGQDVA